MDAPTLTARATDASEPPSQYLTFMLGKEEFGLGILGIKEIIEFGNVTAVPMMPAWIRGVINLRGAVVPVMDLALRFGRAACEVTRRTCIIIVEIANRDGSQVVGVMVDAVNAVLDIPSSEIEPPPTFGTRIRVDFIRGMAKVGSRFVILLDPDRVLSVDELHQIAGHAEAPVAQAVA